MAKSIAPLRQVLSIVVASLAAATALAQAPAQEAPKNLQVLPKDWTRAQVVNVMQNFNAALGVGRHREPDAPEHTRVGCITCHRGVPEPKQLAEILARTSAERGFAAAQAQYNELKSKYYGAQAYDFSESGLIATAQPLVQTRTDEAIQFLNMNLGLFPQSARTYVALAQAQAAKKDTAGAISSLEKALAIEPNNAAARRQLDQLRAQ